MVEGSVTLQLSARSIGLFEAFYSSLKPVQLMSNEFEVCPSGKFAAGVTEIPFEFVLRPSPGEELFDTYHGVYVNVQYMITANMQRSSPTNDTETKSGCRSGGRLWAHRQLSLSRAHSNTDPGQCAD